MATGTISMQVFWEDHSVTITSADGRTKQINCRKDGYRTISATLVQTDGLYYVAVNDGIYPNISIMSDGNVQLFGMNKGLAVSTNRTLTVRCIYRKI